MTLHPLPVNMLDITEAADRINIFVRRTPVLESEELNMICGGRVLLKTETFQRTGSFKFRGAANFLLAQGKDAVERGVAAVSSGNHGQAVALAASLRNARATVFMPKDAPQLKIRGAKSYGAEVILYDRFNDNREEMVREFIDETGAIYVSPFDDPLIISGQGTLGLEVSAQAKELGTDIDCLLAPCGGGGLSSGTVMSVSSAFPNVKSFIVEPADFDDTGRSLAAGRREVNSRSARSICDALQSPTPGELTFPILLRHNVSALKVSDAEVQSAMHWAFERLKLIIEPGGVVGLAALLFKKVNVEGLTSVVVVSGGNVDAPFFANVLQSEHLAIPS